MSAPTMRYDINLLEDGSVVTKDGEFLGAWDTDVSDVFYQFTPDGATEPLISNPFMAALCQRIKEWHSLR